MFSTFLSGFIRTLSYVIWALLMAICLTAPFLLSYFTAWYLLLYLITIPIMGGLIAVICNH